MLTDRPLSDFGCIDVMDRSQPLLNIDAETELRSRAKKNANFSGIELTD